MLVRRIADPRRQPLRGFGLSAWSTPPGGWRSSTNTPRVALLEQPRAQSVREHVTVATPQSDADPVGDDVGDAGHDEDADPFRPAQVLQGDVERERGVVVRPGGGEHQPEADRHGTERGAHRVVPWALQEVVQPAVVAEPALRDRVQAISGAAVPARR
jgi:hypothetical protein